MEEFKPIELALLLTGQSPYTSLPHYGFCLPHLSRRKSSCSFMSYNGDGPSVVCTVLHTPFLLLGLVNELLPLPFLLLVKP